MQDFTYEQEIVIRARQLSTDINDYFEEQRYKQFTDEYQQEEITDRYLMNVALELLLSELKDMGIESDQTVDDITEDQSQLETLFALRTKFDEENLYQTLRAFSSKSLAEFLNVYEAVELPEDLLLELGPWLADKFPSDPMWSLIYQSTNVWYSTNYFGDHLNRVRTLLLDKSDLNSAVVNDSNVDSVTRFLHQMEIRSNTISIYIKALEKMFPELNVAQLDHYISTYDTQKLNNDQLPLFAAYNDLQPAEEPPFLKYHHITVNHHVEYWVDKAKREREYGIAMPTYTKEIAVMIVVSLVLDNLSPNVMQQKLLPLKKIILPELYSFTTALTTIDYSKILKGTN